MRLTRRDGLATLFVATAAAVYALWFTGTAMPGVSTRVLGAVVFGLGWAACMANQSEMAVVYGVDRKERRPPMTYVVLASVLGAVTLLAGIITLLSANEAMLATLVAAMVALWAMSTVRHAITGVTKGQYQAIQEPLDKAA